MVTSSADFVEGVVALCAQKSHAQAVTFADENARWWSDLTIGELAQVFEALITSGRRETKRPATATTA
jgi:hypothetical protein